MKLAGLACFAGLGGFLFGYDLGVIGGALLGITADLQIAQPGSLAQSCIVGAFKLGAFFGTFYGGAAMLRYGRRSTIAINSIFATLGPVLMALASNTAGLVAGRLVGGFGVGACAIVVPAYLAEVAPVEHRGATVQAYEVMLCLGLLVATLMDWALGGAGASGWRWMVGMPAFPAAAMALALVLLPESPRWLVMRGKLDGARAALQACQSGPRAQSKSAEGRPGSHDYEQPTQRSTEQLLLDLIQDVQLEQTWAQARRQPTKANAERSAGGEGAEDEPLLLCAPPQSSGAGDVELQSLSAAVGFGSAHSGSCAGAGAGLQGALSATPQIRSAGLPIEASSRQGQEVMGGVHKPQGTDDWSLHGPGTERTIFHTLAVMLRDIVLVATGVESRAFALAMWLAFFNQANASSAIINYAPGLLVWQGAGTARYATLLSAAVSLTKMVGVLIGLLLVDRLGRRPLLVWGACGCSLAMAAMTLAAALGTMELLLACMCLFILFFSASWAGLFWVVISELFSMPSKSPACSAATALLFLTGSLTDVAFMTLMKAARAYSFLVFAGVGGASSMFVWVWLPETKGRSVAEIQALLAKRANS